LIRELQVLRGALQSAAVPGELIAYRDKLFDYAAECDVRLAGIRQDLQSGIEDIIEDIRSETAQATERVRLLSRRLAAPVLTADRTDRLSLYVIQWIHETNPRTRTMPAACSDGDPQVWPFLLFAPLYNFPTLIRRGLLHLPILSHEYGHVLFLLHRPELLELVEELQESIENELEPLSNRNDELASRQRELQREVVDTWYAWAQEFFCDAVGLTMAGPSYLHAFSSYLSRLERSDLIRPQQYLAGSSHPVLGLRMKLLLSRAGVLGYRAVVERYKESWSVLANALEVREDYFGYYEDSWEARVQSTIDDMLTEAAPRLCTMAEANAGTEWKHGETPIFLLNCAWNRFLAEPTEYTIWESHSIADFLL
jgi:hypothetical protein